ncbi:PSP1 domain-containing protein [Haliangium ochraceum]|uniref:PSP1 domain protein n=1 Tax=Haliangium ochraceum (strain DSM 14365 / JCM 11303 / SMP-2) TaxID=502025 RepID=D0LQE2_HALO1|nr:regulatory iron-sulfur-containing complex subunit RicT [Haliangium ochraceum]ACY18951.1 PSP1 domain protein [Haliangium ochraceum DSM 14365]
MSEDSSSKSPDSSGRPRRRRRRRGGRADGGGASESGGRSESENRGGRSESENRGGDGDGKRGRRRRRRRGRGEGEGEGSSASASASASSAGAASESRDSGSSSGEGREGGRGRSRRTRTRRRGSGAAGEGGESRREGRESREGGERRGEARKESRDERAAARKRSGAAQESEAFERGDSGGEGGDGPDSGVEFEPLLPPGPPVSYDEPPEDEHDPSTWFLDQADDENPHDLGAPVHNIAGIKFSAAGRIFHYDAGDVHYERGEMVMVASERGMRMGTVAVSARRMSRPRGNLRSIVRRPNANDRRAAASNESRGAEALAVVQERVREQGLPMKVFRAEFPPSSKKVVVYFTAEERLDFRELVRDLSKRLRCRVEMRQTGVRDEAKLVGGIGSCGRELCCTTWLPEFVPVSIKMAKDQGLVLNPTKVSGQCGRLKCCLVYEQETYAALRKGLPKLGKRVVTEEGEEGRVVEVDVLHQRVRVAVGPGDFRVLNAGEVRPMFPSQKPRGGGPGDARDSRTRGRGKQGDGRDAAASAKPDDAAAKPDAESSAKPDAAAAKPEATAEDSAARGEAAATDTAASGAEAAPATETSAAETQDAPAAEVPAADAPAKVTAMPAQASAAPATADADAAAPADSGDAAAPDERSGD